MHFPVWKKGIEGESEREGAVQRLRSVEQPA